MIELIGTVVLAGCALAVLAAAGFVAWAVSSDERTERVVRWIERWGNRKGRR